MYDIFVKLLALNGKTTADVCRETGISQSTISNWKKRGNILSPALLQKIADYFNVSLDYMMGKETDNEKWFPNSEMAIKTSGAGKSKFLQKLGEIMMTEVDGTWQLGGPPKMSQRAKDIMDIFDSLSESDQNTLYEYAKFLEQKHQSNP